jgi:hypothetical protein
MVKLKSLGLMKAGDNDAMKQMKSLGYIGSGKMEAFIAKFYKIEIKKFGELQL